MFYKTICIATIEKSKMSLVGLCICIFYVRMRLFFVDYEYQWQFCLKNFNPINKQIQFQFSTYKLPDFEFCLICFYGSNKLIKNGNRIPSQQNTSAFTHKNMQLYSPTHHYRVVPLHIFSFEKAGCGRLRIRFTV